MMQAHDPAVPPRCCDDVRQGLGDVEHLAPALEWIEGEEEELTWQK